MIHLYTKTFHDDVMPPFADPEILRVRSALPRSGSPMLKLASWVCGTNPSFGGRPKKRAHQIIGEPDLIDLGTAPDPQVPLDKTVLRVKLLLPQFGTPTQLLSQVRGSGFRFQAQVRTSSLSGPSVFGQPELACELSRDPLYKIYRTWKSFNVETFPLGRAGGR